MIRLGAIAIRQSLFDALDANRQDWVRFAFSKVLHIQPLINELLWVHPDPPNHLYYVVEDHRLDPCRVDALAAFIANATEIFNRLKVDGVVPTPPSRQQARDDLVTALNSPTVLISPYDDAEMRYDALAEANAGTTATDAQVLNGLENGFNGNPGIGVMGINANDVGQVVTFTDLRAVIPRNYRVPRLVANEVDFDRLKRQINAFATKWWGAYPQFDWQVNVLDPQGVQAARMLMFDSLAEMVAQGWAQVPSQTEFADSAASA